MHHDSDKLNSNHSRGISKTSQNLKVGSPSEMNKSALNIGNSSFLNTSNAKVHQKRRSIFTKIINNSIYKRTTSITSEVAPGSMAEMKSQKSQKRSNIGSQMSVNQFDSDSQLSRSHIGRQSQNLQPSRKGTRQNSFTT